MEITTTITVTKEEALEFITNRGWVAEIDGKPNPETFKEALTGFVRGVLVEQIIVDGVGKINEEINKARQEGLLQLRTLAETLVEVEIK